MVSFQVSKVHDDVYRMDGARKPQGRKSSRRRNVEKRVGEETLVHSKRRGARRTEAEMETEWKAKLEEKVLRHCCQERTLSPTEKSVLVGVRCPMGEGPIPSGNDRGGD